MKLRVRPLTWATAWGGALYGVLCLEMIPGDFSHALCGPWG